MNSLVRIDLSASGFQESWFALSSRDAEELRKACFQISRMSWIQVYQSKGLKWEKISGLKGEKGEHIYSMRITKKFRALVTRDGDFLRITSLHPDHDSAYQ